MPRILLRLPAARPSRRRRWVPSYVAPTTTDVLVTNTAFRPTFTDCSTFGTGSIQANLVYPSAQWCRWNSCGELFRITYTAGTTGAISLLLDTTDLNGLTAGDCPTLMWRYDAGNVHSDWTIDSGPLAYSASTVVKSLYTGLTNGTAYTITVWWKSRTPNAQNMWDTGAPFCCVKTASGGAVLRIDASGSVSAPTLPAKNFLWYGASLSEGDFINAAAAAQSSHDASRAFPTLVGEGANARVHRRNWGGQGWSLKGIGAVAPSSSAPSFYNATAANQSWDKFAGGRTMLVSGTCPVTFDEIWIDQGYNDGASALSASDVTAALQAVRVAHATAKIRVMADYLGTNGNSAALSTGVTNAADGNCKYLAMTQRHTTAASPGTLFSWDENHPNQYAAGVIAAEAARLAQAADGGVGGNTYSRGRLVNAGGG